MTFSVFKFPKMYRRISGRGQIAVWPFTAAFLTLAQCAPVNGNTAGGASTPWDTSQYSATIDLDITSDGPPAPRRITGTNVQWVDGADNLVADFARGGVASSSAGIGPAADAGVRAGPNLAAFVPTLLSAIEQIGPGALRFPGGTNADTYHWKGGVGPLPNRGLGDHVFRRQPQRMLFGTDEFLSLASRLQAEPIITVNVPTGSDVEAAEWVRYVNMSKSASDAPRVRYWEIGNEPYLREDTRPELTLQPAEFATRATAIIRAMKAVDPRIAVGLPIRLDQLGTLPLVHFPGYAETVLRNVAAPVDFVALHNAYLPLVYKGGAGGTTPNPNELFATAMSASRVVEQDLANVEALWHRLRPGQPYSVAVTEYNAMFSLGGSIDAYVQTLGAALYVADVLRVFAGTPTLLFANQWSISGNAIFGMLNTDGTLRPTAQVFRAFTRALRGRLVSASVTAPTFQSDAVGAVPAYEATPVLAVIAAFESPGTSLAEGTPALRGPPGALAGAVTDGGRIRLLIINKAVARSAEVQLRIGNSPAVSPRRTLTNVHAETLAPPPKESAFRVTEVSWRSLPVRNDDGAPPRVILPPQSFTYIDIDLSESSATLRVESDSTRG